MVTLNEGESIADTAIGTLTTASRARATVGDWDGTDVVGSDVVGPKLGTLVGAAVGSKVVGPAVGTAVGAAVGMDVGCLVGANVGIAVGAAVGMDVG